MTMWTNEEREYGKDNLDAYKKLVEEAGEELSDIAQGWRVSFHEKYKRAMSQQVPDDVIFMVCASSNLTEEEKGEQWFLDRLIEAEQETIAAAMKQATGRGASMQQLLDKANNDAELQELTTRVADTNDLKSKAPAHVAFRLRADYTPEDLDTFAIPYSNEEKGMDGDKNKLGDNERPRYDGKWDRYYKKAATGDVLQGYWYLDFAAGTTAGSYIRKNMERVHFQYTPKNDDDATIIVDGKVIDVRTMSEEQRKTMYAMLNARVLAIAESYRKGMQVILQWNDLYERLGNKTNDAGEITDIGVCSVEWVWADPQDRSKGLTPNRKVIRVSPIFQEDIIEKQPDGKEVIKYRKGSVQSHGTDFFVSEFINLSLDNAFVEAGKNGRDTPRFVDVVTSRKKKPTATPAGNGKGQATETQSQTAALKVDVNVLPELFSNLRLMIERASGSTEPWKQKFVNLQPDQQKAIAYDMVELSDWLEKAITQPILDLAAKVRKEKKDAEDKELAEKLTKAGNA